LYPVNHEEKRLPAKELRILGEVVHDVGAAPSEVHHGRQRCGLVAVETIQIRSLTNRSFRVKGVSSRSDDLQVRRTSEESNAWAYSLRLRFTKVGDQQVTADFLVEDEDAVEYVVTVPVRYHGLPECEARRFSTILAESRRCGLSSRSLLNSLTRAMSEYQ
jgi:hypothetical protein